MRYSVRSNTVGLSQVEAEVKKVGGQDIRVTPRVRQVFCDLTPTQADALASVPGLIVKESKTYRAQQFVLPSVEEVMQAPPAEAETLYDLFYSFRNLFTPPLTGTGLTVAVLDSGIRRTHETLENKVVYEKDCIASGSTDDVFNHGTSVAFMIAGGIHAPGEQAGVSPGARLMNVKVIGDDGTGSDESVIAGIEEVIDLLESARSQGLWLTDDMFPNVLNLSFGAEDDGDPDNPVREACRVAVEEYGLDVIAAAGNEGPDRSTISVPAVDPAVLAVGAIESYGELLIWEQSSRGPTLDGETKPDYVLWGTSLYMAGAAADDEYVTKSGTSFAAPILSGLTGLVWETGRRVYGEVWEFRWIPIREFAPYYCVKPADSPLDKDNSYGYGLPGLGTLVGQIGGVATPTQQMVEGMTMVVMMAMLMGMATGMMR